MVTKSCEQRRDQRHLRFSSAEQPAVAVSRFSSAVQPSISRWMKDSKSERLVMTEGETEIILEILVEIANTDGVK